MKTMFALIALTVLSAAAAEAPSKYKTVVLEPWGAGHATPNGKVYYDLMVSDDGGDTVQLTLLIINNTGHHIAIRKDDLKGSLSVSLLDAQGHMLTSYPGCGSGGVGPEEYMVFDTLLHGDGSYCPLSTVQRNTEIDRAEFNACSRVEVDNRAFGFQDDMRALVIFEVKAGFDRATKQPKKEPPTGGSVDPPQGQPEVRP